MDEFLILLQAKLDEAKSKGNVNADIKELQNQLDKLKVQVELDPKVIQNLANSIEKLVNQKIVISNIGIDTKTAVKTGQDYGKQFSHGVSQGLNSNSLKLDTFKKSLENIGMGSKEIDSVASKINNLGVQIETLNQTRSSGKKDILSVNIAGTDQYGQAIKLTQQYNIATGELVNTIDAVSTAQQGIGNNTNSIKKAENVFADYTAKIEQFKSTNSNILSGLLDPLSDFESKLSGLKNGTASIDDVINSYKNLNAEASKITSNLSAQFNKVDSAVRNITKGDEVIASLRADFKGLTNAPKEVNSELTKCEKLLLNVKNIERQEGRTVNWSAAYKEWEQSLDSLKAKIATLKKEQLNVASSQIFNTKDLDSQGKIYIQKVNNTIEKTKAELESKLRNAGYMDIQIKGTEDASGKIKSLTATVTDATGAFKQLNFERAKIQNNGKAQAGFVQTDDVKVIGNISSSIGKVQSNLSSLKTKWEEQGVLVGEFKTKVEQLESSLSSIGSKGELNFLKTQIQELKNEASTILKVNEIQLLSNGGVKNDYSTQIAKLEGNFRTLGLAEDEIHKKTANVATAFNNLKSRISQPFDESNYQEIISLNDKLQKELIESGNEYTRLQSSAKGFVSIQQRLSKANAIEAWNQKNSAAIKDVRNANEAYIASLRNLNMQMTKMQFNEISNEFKKTENSMRTLGRLGASFKDQMSQAAQSFTQWLSVSSGIMLLISKARNAVTELKDINGILTEISKTADQLSKFDLVKLGMSAFSTAGKYGKKASDYLTGIQEMYRAVYENAGDLAELSTLAQSAGDMEADLANDYLIATDAAYKLKGNTEALNEVLDGQNYITNRNALSMQDLAEATKIAASQSASSGIAVDKATAAMGTMIATTRQGGDVAARAWKGILMNLQQVKGEVEDGEILDEESLSKYEKACEDLGVSLKEVKNGVLSLRDPMQILEELSKAYTALDESDARRANLISAVGGKYRGNQLNALLENWSLYEKMLNDYAEGSGSAMEEAMKSANNWEGSMNRLGNTFTKIMNNIVKSDAVITVTNSFNGFLSVIDKVTSKLGSLGTIGLGAGLFTFIKNVGMAELY